MAYVPPNGYRIRKGETVVGLVWSNTSVVIGGSWRVIYDDGVSDMLAFNATASGSARAAVVVPTQWSAARDGYVVEGAVIFEGTGPTQRGQTYIQVFIVSDDLAVPSTRQVISAGYVYAGHAPTLGEIVEPGPAGGHGMQNALAGVDQAAGVEMSDTIAVTGAIRRLHSVSVSLAQGITQTPRPSLVIDDGGTLIFDQEDIGAALAASTTVQLTWAWGEVVNGNNVNNGNLEAPLPAHRDFGPGAPTGSFPVRVRTITAGIGGNTNYAAPIYYFEEWVMPN